MIKKVAINNFRGFDEFGCDCFAPITVIGGRNNSGKSSLLEALALTLDIKGCDMLLSTNRIRGVDMSKLDDLRSLFNQGDTTRGVLIASEFDTCLISISSELILYLFTSDFAKQSYLSKSYKK